jgi:hypothetical protein
MSQFLPDGDEEVDAATQRDGRRRAQGAKGIGDVSGASGVAGRMSGEGVHEARVLSEGARGVVSYCSDPSIPHETARLQACPPPHARPFANTLP